MLEKARIPLFITILVARVKRVMPGNDRFNDTGLINNKVFGQRKPPNPNLLTNPL